MYETLPAGYGEAYGDYGFVPGAAGVLAAGAVAGLPAALSGGAFVALRALVRQRQRKRSARIAQIDAEMKALRQSGWFKNRKKLKALRKQRRAAVKELRAALKADRKQTRARRRSLLNAEVKAGRISAAVAKQAEVQMEQEDVAAETAMIEEIIASELPDEEASLSGYGATDDEADAEEGFIAKNKWLILGALAIGGYYAHSQGLLKKFTARANRGKFSRNNRGKFSRNNRGKFSR